MKSLLIIIPYDKIYPPMNGGMKRCFHLANQLARYFQVTLIIHQDKESFLEAAIHYQWIKNVTIYSICEMKEVKGIFSLLPSKLVSALKYRWIKKELSITTDSNLLKYHSLLKMLLTRNKYDAVILENLSTLNATSIIRKYDKLVKVIYDAHNVDSILSIGTPNYSRILKVESKLYKNTDLIFTCSAQDKNEFEKINDSQLNVAIIPNGVEVDSKLFDAGVKLSNPEFIIFCGVLSSTPNRQGLLWFHENIWSKIKKCFPNLKLLIVGSGNIPESFEPLLTDRSLIFTGPVDNVKPWYNKAAVSIVPLLTGSGTRLKVLEAMSLGVPVVSTTKGAEGIEYINNQEIIIADNENDFAESVIELLKDKEKRLQNQLCARKLVKEKYDWNVIGEKLSNLNYLLKAT